ncbi:MAG: hypothetical protein U5K35_08170 [Rhodohalobacter sp.]|nr:hypothetical protein [Rhodohalobacter sp.]
MIPLHPWITHHAPNLIAILSLNSPFPAIIVVATTGGLTPNPSRKSETWKVPVPQMGRLIPLHIGNRTIGMK